MSSNIIDLQQQIEEARRRKAEAEAAEQARLEAEARHQREAAEAEAIIRHAEGEVAAQLLAQEAQALEGLAAQLQQYVDEINAHLNALLAAVTGDSDKFPLAALLEVFSTYQENRALYWKAYESLQQTLPRSKNAHPGANFSEAENVLLVLRRPDTFRDSRQLLDGWLGDNTPRLPTGALSTTPPAVDAVCALVAAMLERGGKYGVKKFFRF